MSTSRFLVQRANLCGVFIASDGGMDLALGLIADNPIGVCLQVEGYDVTRLSDRVLFRDNGTAIEPTSFDAPTIASPTRL